LPYDHIPHADAASHLSPLVSHYTTAIITAARHHPELDGMFLTARCVRDAEKLVRASGVIFREEGDDTTISEDGLCIFVAGDLAEMLEDRTLDVEETPSGIVELIVR